MDEHDGPSEVVAVGLHKVRPVLLGVLAKKVAGQRDGQAHEPDEEDGGGDVALAQASAHWMHDAHVTVARDCDQCQHARHNAHHLHVRVELAEEGAEHPVLVHAAHHAHPDARGEYGQIAHGQVEYEVVGGARHELAVAAYDDDDEAVADERDDHEHDVERDAQHGHQEGRQLQQLVPFVLLLMLLLN